MGKTMTGIDIGNELAFFDANGGRTKLKFFESKDPSTFNDQLETLITETDGKLLLSRGETAHILNISEEWLMKLTKLKKISAKKGGYRVDDVYKYKQKQHKIRMKALEEIAEIENSVSAETC